jgi:hypothetical protein
MAVSMAGPARIGSVPKLMAPIYEKIVGLTDDIGKRQLNSKYRDLARAMGGSAVPEAPEPVRVRAATNLGVRPRLCAGANKFSG